MNIAIDCRYIGMSGIGRVLEGILDNLDYNENKYFLVGPSFLKEKYPSANVIICDSNPYSKKGLVDFPKKINGLCECIIIPNFLVPFGIKIRIITVVHDLIFLDLKESTKGFIDYYIKKKLLKRCFKKSKYIFCDSAYTMERAKIHYPKEYKKCALNYPGISSNVIRFSENDSTKVKENKIVFVGNVKPHKGISKLLNLFLKCNLDYTLKIIGKKDTFLNSLNIPEENLKNVSFTGRISDEELLNEISTAKYLVQPSLYEGFGLPPLEALYLGTKPIVSKIDVFYEVYRNLDVVFFDFDDCEEFKQIIEQDYSLSEKNKSIIDEKYDYAKFTKGIISKCQ